ncbi:Bug family tripartite tricarboxylate transporter substrate binding protein [Variovorax paradoxus]|uniref:Bug family tripartite tricarboxylate transporter substrate binding protein n=1 Tax=Variovorax paradoxus TaxID=34073 RepID=UPI00277FBFF5|nr:tripartite tricarboxylate transporter substrate binding protein [Variovorax paradoxus]MDQ0586083.1 tripartite-type tricarboxylate transporter receptor subunit TctC [Variovorax paradoxus]
MQRRFFAAVLFGLIAAAGWPAAAQTYPAHPVKLVIPVPPGGSADVVGRLLANAVSAELGQPVIVDNRAGAAGSVGTASALKAPADGYTLVQCSIGSCAINPSLYKNVGYDLFKDMAPVILLGASINVLAVNNDAGIRSVKDLVDQARRQPMAYASSGVGASNHLAAELLKKMAGIEMTHVPYKGSGPAITDLIGGQVPVFFDNEPSILPFIKQGKVRALAVTGKTRSANLPDVPTMEELGFAGFVIEPWYAFAAPAGTPEPAIRRLNTAFNNALNQPAVRDRMVAMGITPAGGAPDVLGRLIRSEYTRWAELIRVQGIKGE